MAVTVRTGDGSVEAVIGKDGRITIDGHSFTVASMGQGLFVVSNDQGRWHVAVAGPPDQRWVAVDGEVGIVEVAIGSPARRKRTSPGDAMVAPMPATVVSIEVTPGQAVTRGEIVILLEAMKMELPVRAPRDGIVHAVLCSEGQLVQPGVPLVELEQAE